MAGPRSKVVPIKAGSGGSGKGKDGNSVEMFAAPLIRLQERCRPLLQECVQALFDQADDALFELADRAVNNAEQNMFFESMREVRIKRRGIEQALMREVHEGFRCLVLGVDFEHEASPLEGPAGATLSLVEHDELEEIVAVDGMIGKAEKEFAGPLALLTSRIDTLVPTRNATIKSNPLGPARLCNSFLEATRALELDIKAKLVLFKLFDRHVLKHLERLYEAGNTVLAEEGVLPRLTSGGQPANPAAEAGEAEHVFNDLQHLLGQARHETGYLANDRSGLVAPGLAPSLPRDVLMQLLGDIQQQQIVWLARQQATLARGMVPQQVDVLRALNQLLQQRLPSQAVSIGQVDDDAINLVSMLFQFILEDRNLAPAIKGLLARLQIPILKMAMLDKSFFGKGGHPARKLLNEVANASLGWAPTGDLERDPFYLKVEALVRNIVDSFTDDVAVFQDALTDFIAFVEMDRRRASLVEQRTIDAEDGRAKSELARTAVQDVLDARLADRQVPAAVTRLLQEGWSNVLFLICLKEGMESESWQRALQTVDDLLDSVRPVTDFADRARLLRTLPALLKQLRSGLNKIGFNPFDLNQLFSELEHIHLQRLKKEETAELAPLPEAEREPVAPAVSQPAQPVETKTLDEVLSERRAQGELEDLDRELAEHFGEDETAPVAEAAPDQVTPATTAPVAEAPAVSGDALELVDRLQVGGWVEFHQPGGKALRCRLAAIIRATGKYIFVNRAGVKVAEDNREGLAKACQAGELTVLDEGRLFDRALESVIGNLREMKSRGS